MCVCEWTHSFSDLRVFIKGVVVILRLKDGDLVYLHADRQVKTGAAFRYRYIRKLYIYFNTVHVCLGNHENIPLLILNKPAKSVTAVKEKRFSVILYFSYQQIP